MNPVKVNDFCNAYARALNLDEETRNMIKSLIMFMINIK